jgi:hypothetical protein
LIEQEDREVKEVNQAEQSNHELVPRRLYEGGSTRIDTNQKSKDRIAAKRRKKEFLILTGRFSASLPD